MLYRNRPRNDTNNESNDAKNFKSNSGSFTPEYDQQLKKRLSLSENVPEYETHATKTHLLAN